MILGNEALLLLPEVLAVIKFEVGQAELVKTFSSRLGQLFGLFKEFAPI